jgi:hypothetical protein
MVCIAIVLLSKTVVSVLVNDTYSSEFKITENSECIEEPQHMMVPKTQNIRFILLTKKMRFLLLTCS